MLNYPREIPIETPFGKMFLAVTSGEHIHLDGSSNGKAIEVNRVALSVSLHLHREGGKFTANMRDLYCTRKDNKEPSWAAKEKIVKVLPEAVNEFLEKNPELVQAGARYDLNRKRADLEEKIAKHEGELVRLRKELEAMDESPAVV